MTSIGFPYQFNKNVSFVIATFLSKPVYKFLDWIEVEKLSNWKLLTHWLDESMIEKYLDVIEARDCWDFLCYNPNAISIIEKNLKKIQWVDDNSKKYNWDKSWINLIKNKNTNHLLGLGCKHFNSYHWAKVSSTSNNIEFMETNINKLSLELLCYNPNPEVHYLIEKIGIEKLDQYCWQRLSKNEHAIQFLEHITNQFTTNLEKIDWHWLSCNKNAVHILKQFPDKVDFDFLIMNENASELIKEKIKEIGITNIENNIWSMLCKNPHGVEILEVITNNFTKHLDNIDWVYLSGNPNAIQWITTFFDFCDIEALCQNKNASHLIEKLILENPNQIDDYCWSRICIHKEAVHLFKKYKHLIFDKIAWASICWNSSIAEIDKQESNKKTNIISEFIYNL